MVAYGPIPQPPRYHDFADQRMFLGVPNAFDVLSNLAFAIVGLWGLRAPRGGGRSPGYLLFVAAVLATAVGSSYYHWAPDNARLFWDRVPIALAAAGLLAGAYAETHTMRRPVALTLALSAFGVASVVWWSVTDRMGVGDLRPYLLIQLAPILLIPLWQAIARSAPRDRIFFGIAAVLYVLAKVAELADRQIFEALGVMSGHTLKHLLAAVASAVLVANIVEKSRRK